MPSSISTLNADDLVSRLIDRSTLRSGYFPVPLIATSYDVTFAGGLACITARRTFRNQEADTIEATLTFPVPVHAVLYALEARIGGRIVKAIAQDRSAAREAYEDAVDRGKTAVLHEELLKGIHMLSVAHVAPGTEIEVTARFAQVLSWIGGRAVLRIPTTVGDVYGVSGLADSDELAHGGPVAAGDLNVVCEQGATALIGGAEISTGTRVPLDRPIRIEVKGWTARDIRGLTAAGEAFRLKIAPVANADEPLDAAFMIDHSGSMGEVCASSARLTKHAALLLGLNKATRDLKETDRINIWQFDDAAEDLGTAHGAHVAGLIRMLSGPGGGTEIGGAIHKYLKHRSARDMVLVTDGKSHALDVHKLAHTGVRFSVVLIGDDSLEANVGHLATLTGGEIFAGDGAETGAALKSVVASLRAASRGEEGGAHLARGRRSGMEIVADRVEQTAAIADSPEIMRAAGAYVAGLRLARLTTADATKLAVAEGLVSHLTSLVLVDEEGGVQADLPAMRKVHLPSPAASRPKLCVSPYASGSVRQNFSHGRSRSVVSEARRCFAPEASYMDDDDMPVVRPSPPSRSYAAAFSKGEDRSTTSAKGDEPSQAPRLTQLPRRIDWRNEGQRLVEGNLIGLPNDVADAIDAAALIGVVKRAAKRLGVSARVFVIGLLARAVSGSDRHAERVYRAILARAKTSDIAHAAERLGLSAAA